jgi:hypothetical protein
VTATLAIRSLGAGVQSSAMPRPQATAIRRLPRRISTVGAAGAWWWSPARSAATLKCPDACGLMGQNRSQDLGELACCQPNAGCQMLELLLGWKSGPGFKRPDGRQRYPCALRKVLWAEASLVTLVGKFLADIHQRPSASDPLAQGPIGLLGRGLVHGALPRPAQLRSRPATTQSVTSCRRAAVDVTVPLPALPGVSYGGAA